MLTDSPPTEAEALETEIHSLLDGQIAAWNRGDLEGYMAPYWRSPQLTLSSGKECFRGWQPTLETYQKRYRGDVRLMGQLALGGLEIEGLGSDAALVRGCWHMDVSAKSLEGLFTLILRKLPEGWRIIHAHTTA